MNFGIIYHHRKKYIFIWPINNHCVQNILKIYNKKIYLEKKWKEKDMTLFSWLA